MAVSHAERLEPADLDRFCKLLQALARRLRGQAASMDEETRKPVGGHEAGELSNAPMHLADAGSEEFLQDMNAALLENSEYLTTEVIAALDRVALGTFGHCEACGKLIARERLDAIPHTRYCVECAEKLGAGLDVNVNNGRPQTADVLGPERPERSLDRLSETRADARTPSRPRDVHAAETPGGGSASGGLAGTNIGRGDPDVAELAEEGGSSDHDVEREREDDDIPQGGRSGGAVGGTPARKRSAGE